MTYFRGALVAVYALAMVACGPAAGHAGAGAATRLAAPQSHQHGSIIFAPPAPSDAPAKTSQDALAACGDALGQLYCPTDHGPPAILLLRFTDKDMGRVNLDGSVQPTYVNVLAYVIVWHNVPAVGLGKAPPSSSGGADYFDVVDANSGRGMFSFTGGD